MDLRRHAAAKAAHDARRRGGALPALQRPAHRSRREQGLRAAHDHDPPPQRTQPGRERRLRERLLLPRPILGLPLAAAARRIRHGQRHGLRPACGRARWHRRDPARARRLARGGEHELVPRPHARFHRAERVQGQRRDDEHLQFRRSRQRGHQRRRQPALPERHGPRLGQPRLRRQPRDRGQGLRFHGPALVQHLQHGRLPGRRPDGELPLQAVHGGARTALSLPHPERLRVALLEARPREPERTDGAVPHDRERRQHHGARGGVRRHARHPARHPARAVDRRALRHHRRLQQLPRR